MLLLTGWLDSWQLVTGGVNYIQAALRQSAGSFLRPNVYAWDNQALSEIAACTLFSEAAAASVSGCSFRYVYLLMS